MSYKIDKEYFGSVFSHIVNIPSPTGYYRKLNPVLEQYATELGLEMTYDNKSTAYLTVPGEDPSKTVQIAAHADTIGFMVRSIDGDGTLRVRNVGGVNYQSTEGESATVITRDGRQYTGLIACQSHSVHVFDDARSSPRDEHTMIVLLDEKVSSAKAVKELGIRHGDFVAVQPRCTITENGFIKSRFIDDKAAVAICFTALKYLKEQGLKPKYNTIFSFPYGEEIGLGGNYVPAQVSEFIALDIGLIGPGLEGNEYSVSICPKDASVVYDFDLTSHLIDLAEKHGCSYAVDLFKNYGSDAGVAVKSGNNLRAAVFGMAVHCSHGMERTHMDGIENTAGLLLAYLIEG
jgi:putative aminopeptidase FrvX